MDHKRNLLIAALVVVSYLLLLAWNKDYPATPNVPVETATVPTQSQSLDLPTATTSDLPQTAPTAAAAAPATPSQNLITVNTPTQRVLIDTVGGDIVRLSLPQYPIALQTPDDPFVLLRNDSAGVYVAQSGLIGRNGADSNANGRPRYASAQDSYSVTEGELTVDLSLTTAENVSIIKRYTFNASDYLIKLQYLITNNGSAPWSANMFGQIKRDGSTGQSTTSGMRLNNFLGAALTSPDDPYIKLDFEDIEDGEDPIEMTGGWIGFSQHYFLGAWVPAAEEQNTLSVRSNTSNEYLLGFVGQEHTIAPGQSLTLENAFWAGPKNQDRLEEISPGLGRTIDYGKLWFVASPIFHLLKWINNLVANFGLSIVLLTVVIRILFYPLSAKQFASQAGMKRLQPKLAQLKERYGDDKQKMMQAQMELWKKEGVNPFSGCLPIFLQMPVFLGIYWVLNESVELRQAPFLWYQDLSAMDPYFILPILLGGAYFLQQHMTPMVTTDPMQAKMMKWMPVAFSVFFLWFPAGLVLYYLANALLGILQQWYFNVRAEKAALARS
jgi:YidC/Oxa1 family membrane protein insertase